MERVEDTEERLCDSIGFWVTKNPQRARDYNFLLDKSKSLNKIIQKKITEQLYNTKCIKYESKVQDPLEQIMIEDGSMQTVKWKISRP